MNLHCITFMNSQDLQSLIYQEINKGQYNTGVDNFNSVYNRRL